MKLRLHAFRLSLCLLVFIFLSSAVLAQTKTRLVENLLMPVEEDSQTTYLDLLRLIFPDAEPDAATGVVAKRSIALHHVSGDDEGKVYEGEMTISTAEMAWVKAYGRRRLLMLIDVGTEQGIFTWGDMHVLAVFELKDKPVLKDAVDVQTDQLVFFDERQPVLAVSTETDAYLIANHHFGGGAGYLNLTLISLVKDKLRVILDKIPTLTNDSQCGNNHEEKASLTLADNPPSGFGNITVNLTRTWRADGAECARKTRAGTKNFVHRFVWNERQQKYVGAPKRRR